MSATQKLDVDQFEGLNFTIEDFEDPPADLIAAEADAAERPIETVDPANPKLFEADLIHPYFARLRKDAPVQYHADNPFGAYWSITRYDDIMAIDIDHQRFSSAAERGGITITSRANGNPPVPMFIAMDPPKHDDQRATVQPMFTPKSLQNMGPLIRERAGQILDGLPIGEEFDWVDKVSMELTAMTLATLFGFPQEERRKLTYWSDIATALPSKSNPDGMAEWRATMMDCYGSLAALFEAAKGKPDGDDLMSALANGESTKDMPPMEMFGNFLLLIVGGNDTTRNTISSSVNALHTYPDQDKLLRDNPSLVPNMVSETIRWQTPLAHMARTALEDVEFGGQTIREGDKVIMWYVSGNFDETAIDAPREYRVDRQHARRHLSFGYGIHRCVGNRLAEMQLQIIWEEILKRFPKIEVVGEPTRVPSTFVRGFKTLPVRIPERNAI